MMENTITESRTAGKKWDKKSRRASAKYTHPSVIRKNPGRKLKEIQEKTQRISLSDKGRCD